MTTTARPTEITVELPMTAAPVALEQHRVDAAVVIFPALAAALQTGKVRALGDAYGAGFEYSPPDLIRRHNVAAYYLKHPRHNIRPGCYTDDTQMTLAIVELLLSGERWTAEHLAERLAP